MKYMGSKARHAKDLLPIILANKKPEQWYVEPFVGGANMIDKVKGNRIGADSNSHVINALRYIRDFTTPKNNSEFTEYDYNNAIVRFKDGLKLTPAECYALIAFSFGAKWGGGWSRGKDSKAEQRDYVAEQHRASEKQRPLLQGVFFCNSEYQSLEIPTNSVIYCDPPYANTTGYKDKFDHDKFWRWCREKCAEGHDVFISEYNAPGDFVCVWEKSTGVSVAKNGKHKKAVEKLFRHKSQVDNMIDAGVI